MSHDPYQPPTWVDLALEAEFPDLEDRTVNATDIASFGCAVGEFVDALKKYEKIAAFQCALAGMQAENQQRTIQGHSPAGVERDFVALATDNGMLL